MNEHEHRIQFIRNCARCCCSIFSDGNFHGNVSNPPLLNTDRACNSSKLQSGTFRKTNDIYPKRGTHLLSPLLRLFNLIHLNCKVRVMYDVFIALHLLIYAIKNGTINNSCQCSVTIKSTSMNSQIMRRKLKSIPCLSFS